MLSPLRGQKWRDTPGAVGMGILPHQQVHSWDWDPRASSGAFAGDTPADSWFPDGILGTQAEGDPANMPVSLAPPATLGMPQAAPKTPFPRSLPPQTLPRKETDPPRSQPSPVPDNPTESETTARVGWSISCSK